MPVSDGIRFACPKCQAAYRIESGVEPGTPVPCWSCGAQIVVPKPQAEEPGLGHASLAGSPDDRQVTLISLDSDATALHDSVAELLAQGQDGSGRYVEQGVIAQGGMGEIVLCVDRDIRRPIALKRMLTATADDPSRRARFVEEAQVTGQLEHPNIVPVHELAHRDDGSVYFTMKLVKGKSLADLLAEAKQGKDALSLGDLLQVFLKVCDGVAFAHSRGVLHRDLKPANIMVGDFGEVLVMDWGLAKVKGREDIRSEDIVETSRVEKASTRTLEGSMIGTPAYMPPEQAEGKLDQIDERSDTYSLGAILYEILALERAIRGETQMAVILNVVKGNIVPPEKRAPGRSIPRELSAIAMKCLSKLRARRYRSVLDLKRDISLFLEGRSVSASPDTFGQAVVKLVRRNRGISVSVAVAAAVLIAVTVGFIINLRGERDRARASESVAVKERKLAQDARDTQRKTALDSSESFAKQAVIAAEFHRWEEAEQRAKDAEKVCPDGPWGLYARGRFAQLRNDHEKAVAILRKATDLDPKNTIVKAALEQSTKFLKNLDLSLKQIEAAKKMAERGGTASDWQSLERLGESMMGLEKWREAEVAFGGALRSAEHATNLPPNDKKKTTERIGNRHGEAKAWVACEGFYDSIKNLAAEEQVRRVEAKLSEVNGQAIKVKAEIKDGKWLGAAVGGHALRYLAPLKGMHLTELQCGGHTQVSDLSPLKGMPLTRLSCSRTQVSDLSPLKGMPLTCLDCSWSPVSDLSPLKGMPLTILDCSWSPVSDLSPLKGMPLTFLSCSSTLVTDLSQLKGMPLTSLACWWTKVSDLSALKGMPLTSLDCHWTPVSDLSPLKGMPLTSLACYGTQVSDLGPLTGMPLTYLDCHRTQVSDLSPLKGMPLTKLDCSGTQVSDLSPVKGMPLTQLACERTPVSDLSPVEGMKLREFTFMPKGITRGIEIIRGMKSIKQIGIEGDKQKWMSPDEFWKKYDAGEFSK